MALLIDVKKQERGHGHWTAGISAASALLDEGVVAGRRLVF